MLKLIKKDLLLQKSLILVCLIVAAVFPVFVTLNDKEGIMPPSIILGAITILISMMFLSQTFENDRNSPKSRALLLISGYDKVTQPVSRYLLAAFVIIVISGIFFVASLISKPLNFPSAGGFIRTISLIVVFLSIYIPVAFKFGSRIAQLMLALVILSISIGPQIIKMTGLKIDPSFFQNINSLKATIISASIGIIAILISIIASIKIFKNMEI